MNKLKVKLNSSAIYLIMILTICISCKKKAESFNPQTDSNSIAFTATTPVLGTLPFVAPVRNSNPVLMAKREGKIYVFLKTTAGGDYSVSGFTYDIDNNAFAALKPLSTGLFINSNAFNSTLISVDVSSNLWYASPSLSLNYSTNTDSWTSYNSSTNAGANNGVCTMQGKVYYAGSIYTGGANASTMASNLFNCYDFAKYAWSPVANLPYLAENPALQPYNNQFIYAIGGERITSGSITKKFSVYNSTNNTWATLSNLPFDYYASTNNHTTTILKNKYLLAYSNNKVYLYNLETKLWNNNSVIDLGATFELVNVNIFSNSTLNKEDGDAFYLAGTNSNGEFKIKKYTIK